MAREPEEDNIRELLKTHPKGLTIEEVSKKLSLNRTTAAKYLNAFVLTGQADMRTLGSAKLFYLTERVPLTNVLSLSSDLILILDSDLFIQEINTAFLTYFQLDKADLKETQLIHSPLAQHFSAEELSCIERALDGEGGSREVMFGLLEDGRFFKMKCIPLTFESGARAVGVILEDITEMKTYQQELERRVQERTAEVVEAKDFAEKLIRTANAMIVGLDTSGTITLFNKAAEQVTGFSAGEVLGKNWFEIMVPEERRPSVRDGFGRLLLGSPPQNFESPILTKSGTPRYISWNNSTLSDRKQIQAIISFGIDITERRDAETQLRESQRALATLMGNLPGMAFRCRPDGPRSMEFVSEGSCELTGYEPAELNGDGTISFTGLILPQDLIAVEEQIQKAVANHEKFQVTYRIRTRTGTWKWVWEQGLGVFSEKGDLIAIEGFIIDITDRKNTEEIIKKANKQVALLTSITRHDIINQINSLQGYITILKKRNEDAKNGEMLQTVGEITDTILKQIVFTRDFRNVGAEPPRWIPIRQTLDALMQTVDLGSISLAIETGDLEVYADPLIDKVFFNLIDNSLRHGGHVTRIRVSVEQDENTLSLVYEDDGTGIQNEEKELIFNRGFGKNTGYGLFLIREILAITGFTIRENGISGQGARFEIRIPKSSCREPDRAENSNA